jgi:O-antigen/teichoic acid export membrane protein
MSMHTATATLEARPGPKGRLSAHVAITILGQIAGSGLGVFTGVMTARFLGPQGRGELAALTVWPMWLFILASMGISQAVVFYTGKKLYSLSEIWTGSTVIGAGQSLAVLLVGVLVVPVALRHYSLQVRDLALALLFAGPMAIMAAYPASLLQGRLDFTSFNLIKLAIPFAYAMGLALLFWLSKVSLQGVVVCQIVAYALALAFGYGLLCARVRIRFVWESRACLSLLNYGWKTQLGNVSDGINRWSDQLFLSLLVPPRELGLYAVAVTAASAVLLIPQGLGIVTLARASNEEGAEAGRVIARLFRASLLWLLPTCFALFLAARWLIILVFGPAFEGSALACRILLPGTVALGLNQVLYEGARALGHPAIPSYAQGSAAALTLLGLYLLVPRFGFIGAAMVSTVAYSSVLILMLVLYRFRLRLSLADLLGVGGVQG